MVKCSICNEDYETCGHIVGKAYVGQICHITVRDVRKISEVSIVKEPANKLARSHSSQREVSQETT